jgi:hypothetical protein
LNTHSSALSKKKGNQAHSGSLEPGIQSLDHGCEDPAQRRAKTVESQVNHELWLINLATAFRLWTLSDSGHFTALYRRKLKKIK